MILCVIKCIFLAETYGQNHFKLLLSLPYRDEGCLSLTCDPGSLDCV